MSRGRRALRAIRPYFVENLGLKVVAFVIAFVFYAFVHGAQDAQRTTAVDLVVLLPPESLNKTLINPLPTSVLVSLHGPRSLVDGLTPSDLGNLQLDLRSGRSGRIPLEPSMLNVPAGVSIDFIDPPYLDVAWDQVVERDIRIQVPITGEPAQGFAVTSLPVPEPRTLRARGPRQIVDNLQHARTEAFDVGGLREGAHRRVLGLEPAPSRVNYDTASAAAIVEITPKLLERLFTNLPVVIVGSARASAVPPRVDVRVVGAPARVEALRAEQVVPRVNLQEIGANLTTPNSVAIPVVIELDDLDITVVPKTVVVRW